MDVSFLLKISDPTTVYIYSCWVSAQFSCTTNSTVLTLQMSKYVSCLSFGSLGKTNWPTKGATCSRNLVKFSLTRLVTHNFLIVCCGAILWVRVTQRRMTELQQRQWARYIWAKPFYKWRSKGLGRHSSVPTFSFAVGQYITISMTDSQIVRKKVVNVDPIGSQIIWHFKASRLLITPYLGTRSIGRQLVETSDSHYLINDVMSTVITHIRHYIWVRYNSVQHMTLDVKKVEGVIAAIRATAHCLFLSGLPDCYNTKYDKYSKCDSHLYEVQQVL